MLLIFVLHSELYLTLLTVTTNEIRDRRLKKFRLDEKKRSLHFNDNDNELLVPDVLPTDIYRVIGK